MFWGPVARHQWLMMEADKGGGGSGGTGNDPGAAPTSAAGNNGQPPDLKKDGKDPDAGQPALVFQSEADFQKRVEEMLKERLEREKRKSEDAAKKAAADAAAEAARKNGEWQQLAEQREKDLAEATAKVSEYDQLQQQAKRYQESLKKSLEVQRSGLPESIIKLLDKLDPADQLEWLAANKESLLKKVDGLPQSPPANGAGDQKALEEARKTFAGDVRRFF